jgi:hypothetical protein
MEKPLTGLSIEEVERARPITQGLLSIEPILHLQLLLIAQILKIGSDMSQALG